jgi:hypothetical protein
MWHPDYRYGAVHRDSNFQKIAQSDRRIAPMRGMENRIT